MNSMKNTNTFRHMAKAAVINIERDEYNRDLSSADLEMTDMSYISGLMRCYIVIPADLCNRKYEVTYSSYNNKMHVDEYHRVGTKVIDCATFEE